MPKDAQWTIALDGSSLVVAPLEGDSPVTFTAAPADAEALAAGSLDLNAAFMQGRVKAAGDMKQLFALLKAAQAR